ncbi:MAG TPA: lactonase family protein, partial [Acidimicrobiales bacterium]
MKTLGGVLLLAGAACGNTGAAGPDAGHGANDAAAPSDASAGGDGAADAPVGADSSRDGGPDGAVDAGDAAAPPRLVAYASGYGPDIQWLDVDPTGGLTSAGSVAAFGTAPSFLAVDPAGKHLYAVDEVTPGRVGAYAIDASSGALTFQAAVASGGDGPPFVSVDPQGRWVLVANYTSGTVAVLPIQADGSLGAAADTESVGAEAHMIVAEPSDRFVFVPCKGADFVAQFLFDASTGKLTPNAVPRLATAAGAGPRHLAFHPDGATAYLIAETASTMTALDFDATTGTLTAVQTVSTLPAGFTGTNTAAEVHVHPSGKWLFGSNRGDDSIVVFALDASGHMTPQGFTKTGGTTPRDFTLDPGGAWLYAANQGTGDVVAFAFDAATGTLTP